MYSIEYEHLQSIETLKNNTEWCIKFVRTSNKSTFALKNIFNLFIQHTCFEKYLGFFLIYVLRRRNEEEGRKGNTKSLEGKGKINNFCLQEKKLLFVVNSYSHFLWLYEESGSVVFKVKKQSPRCVLWKRCS